MESHNTNSVHKPAICIAEGQPICAVGNTILVKNKDGQTRISRDRGDNWSNFPVDCNFATISPDQNTIIAGQQSTTTQLFAITQLNGSPVVQRIQTPVSDSHFMTRQCTTSNCGGGCGTHEGQCIGLSTDGENIALWGCVGDRYSQEVYRSRDLGQSWKRYHSKFTGYFSPDCRLIWSYLAESIDGGASFAAVSQDLYGEMMPDGCVYVDPKNYGEVYHVRRRTDTKYTALYLDIPGRTIVGERNWDNRILRGKCTSEYLVCEFKGKIYLQPHTLLPPSPAVDSVPLPISTVSVGPQVNRIPILKNRAVDNETFLAKCEEILGDFDAAGKLSALNKFWVVQQKRREKDGLLSATQVGYLEDLLSCVE